MHRQRSVSGPSGRVGQRLPRLPVDDKKIGSRSVASHLGAGRRGVGSSTEDQVQPRPCKAKNEGLPNFLSKSDTFRVVYRVWE